MLFRSEIADMTHLSLKEIDLFINEGMKRPISMDSPLQEGDDLCVGDSISETTFGEPDKELIQSSIKIDLLQWLQILPERDASIIKQFFGIDGHGLNKLDRDILKQIIQNFDGGPVGVETLAAMTGEDRETLEDVIEPYLLRIGFLQKTARGRVIPMQKMPYLRRLLCGVTTDEQGQLF